MIGLKGAVGDAGEVSATVGFAVGGVANFDFACGVC